MAASPDMISIERQLLECMFVSGRGTGRCGSGRDRSHLVVDLSDGVVRHNIGLSHRLSIHSERFKLEKVSGSKEVGIPGIPGIPDKEMKPEEM